MGSPLSSETEERIEALFAPEEWEQVQTVLVEECGENIPMWKMADLERLRFAVLKLSKMHAKVDFRDVLMAAGIGDVESYKSSRPQRK